MSEQRIDSSVIKNIVAAAAHAPTPDNSQPSTFEWDGEKLVIHLDLERDRHSLNRDFHATYISLGGVLEALQMAATKEHLTPQFDFSLHSVNTYIGVSVIVSRKHESPSSLRDGYPSIDDVVPLVHLTSSTAATCGCGADSWLSRCSPSAGATRPRHGCARAY